MQPYKALGMLSFIEKAQLNKSSSPDKEESTSSRDNKDSSADGGDTWRASVSQVALQCLCSRVGIKHRIYVNILEVGVLC